MIEMDMYHNNFFSNVKCGYNEVLALANDIVITSQEMSAVCAGIDRWYIEEGSEDLREHEVYLCSEIMRHSEALKHLISVVLEQLDMEEQMYLDLDRQIAADVLEKFF